VCKKAILLQVAGMVTVKSPCQTHESDPVAYVGGGSARILEGELDSEIVLGFGPPAKQPVASKHKPSGELTIPTISLPGGFRIGVVRKNSRKR
jgi:hypothetical protein